MIEQLKNEIMELKKTLEKEDFEPLKKLIKAQIEYREGMIKTLELLE